MKMFSPSPRWLVLGLTSFAAMTAVAQTAPPLVNTPNVPQLGKQAVPGLPAPTPLDHPLTEDEAIQVALKNQPSIRQAQAKVAQFHGGVRSAQGTLYPQISANASGIQNSNSAFTSGGSKGWITTATISLAQLLYDFGKSKAVLSQAIYQEVIAIQQLHQAELDVRKSVRLAYITFQQARQLEGYSAGNVANRQRQLDLAEARLRAGVGVPSEVVQAKAALAAATTSLSTSQATLSLARSALALAMGIDPRTELNVAENEMAANVAEDALTPESTEQMVRQALLHRPEILASKAQVDAAHASVRVARSGGAPTLSLTGNLGSRGTGRAFTSENAAIGLGLSWSLYDGGARSGAVRSAEALVTQAKESTAAASLQVTSEVYQALVNKLTAAQNVGIATVQVANAAEFLRIAEGRYKGGIGIFNDAVTASDALYAAQTSYAQNVANYRAAVANLKRALGQP